MLRPIFLVDLTNAICIKSIFNIFQPGEHWILYYNSPANTLEFWDSFALPPEIYVSLPCKVDVTNEKQVQSFSAQTCGMWTTYYLLQRYRGFDMNDIVKPFNDLSTNDIIIAKLFSDLYKINVAPYY